MAGVLEQVWGSSFGQLLVRGSPLARLKLHQSCSAIGDSSTPVFLTSALSQLSHLHCSLTVLPAQPAPSSSIRHPPSPSKSLTCLSSGLGVYFSEAQIDPAIAFPEPGRIRHLTSYSWSPLCAPLLQHLLHLAIATTISSSNIIMSVCSSRQLLRARHCVSHILVCINMCLLN